MVALYARIPCGVFVALHLHHWFGVLPSDSVTGAFEVACASPGADDMTYLYTWSAYPEITEYTNHKGENVSGNEILAELTLQWLVRKLANPNATPTLLEMEDVARFALESQGWEVRDAS